MWRGEAEGVGVWVVGWVEGLEWEWGGSEVVGCVGGKGLGGGEGEGGEEGEEKEAGEVEHWWLRGKSWD